MPTLTESLAQYWAGACYEDLPPDTVRLAKRFLLDTLAAGIAGANTEVAGIVRTVAKKTAGREAGPSVLWGRAETLSPPHAALVNGTACHALELDDFGGCGHSGAVVIPAVVALALRASTGSARTESATVRPEPVEGPTTRSGKDLITAIVAGYDIAARVTEGAGGYRGHNDLGWHSSGTCGTFGAAAAAARMLGLDSERYADALGIAGTYTGGIWAFLADGAMTKRFHPGKASETGLNAALLAHAGMTGPRQVLEAEWGGFYSTYARGIATPEATLKGLGAEFRISRSGMKPYACCRGLHATLDALFEVMRETKADAGAIERMIVHGNEQNRVQFDRPQVGNMLDAQFSFQYALAVGASSGRATLDQFEPRRDGEPEVQRLMGLTEVVADREQPPNTYPPLEIRFRDGRRIERHIRFAKGAPENPLSDDEIERKAVSQIEPVLGKARCGQLLACVASLEDARDAHELARLLAV